MAHPDQIDFKQLKAGVWSVSFAFNAEYVDYLKAKVPYRDRHYDDITHVWTVRGDHYMPALEGVAVQKFRHALRYFTKDGHHTVRNLRTGVETVQGNLF